MKKIKILPSILMLVTCLAVLGVGVFAVAPTQNTISGSITINATNPEFTIKVFRSTINNEGQTVVEESQVGEDYTVRSGVDLALGDIVFELKKANITSDVDRIKFRFEVTSTANSSLGMYFTNSVNTEASKTIEDLSLSNGLVKCSFSNYTCLPAGEKANAYLTFSLEEFVTNVEQINLKAQNICFNIDNYISSLDPLYVLQVGTSGQALTSAMVKAVANNDLTSLTEIKITEGVTSIGDGAFGGCTNLAEISIPNSVVRVGQSAFNKCTKLNYEVENNLKYLGNSENKFLVCVGATSTDITTANINSNTKVIVDGCLRSCSNLTDITIPEGVTRVIFGEISSSLVNLSIPNSIECLDISAGKVIFNLSNIKTTSYNGYEYIGNSNNPYVAVVGGSGSGPIHENTRIVCTYITFWKNNKNLIIPRGIKCLTQESFSYSGCDKIYIPDSVTYLGNYVFYGAFATIYVEHEMQPVGWGYDGVWDRYAEIPEDLSHEVIWGYDMSEIYD